MKNRKLLLIVSLVLAMTMSLGGTLAYLTDTDADVNTMVLGNVQILQNEQQRGENGLEAFEDGQMMLPAVYGVVDGDQTKEKLTVGEYEIEIRNFPNYVDKIVTVTNTGKTNAFVRTLIAIPAGINVDKGAADVSEQWLHYNVVSATDTEDTKNNGWHWGTSTDKKEWPETNLFEDVDLFGDGKLYDITVATNLNVIAPEETTGPNLVGLYLDNDVDYKDGKYYAKDMRKDAADGATMEVWSGTDLKVYVLSQAVQADGFTDAWTAFSNSFGDVNEEKAQTWFRELYVDGELNKDMIDSPGDQNETNDPIVYFNGDPAELYKMLTEATDAGSGDVTVTLTENYDMSKYDWTPVSVDGYNGAGVVTVEGNGHVIKGLNAPLFAGGFAGKSGIVIKDLTIKDSEIVTESSQGAGAFIENADSMQEITLTNCHVKNCTITTTAAECRMGGLIGWVSGYSKQNDGPVKTYVTIKNCSVVDTKIECFGSIGGIIGHAGASDYTWVTIEDCTVTGCELNSADDGQWRVGVAVGTANNGHVTIADITESDNTLTQTGKTAPEGQSNLYGRFVPSGTGTLTVNGVEIK